VGRSLSYVIVGNGIAGATAAETLRAADPIGAITVVADELFPVYYRPALKDYLAGRINEDKLWARPSTFYQQQRVLFVPGHVVGIQTQQQFVQLHNGQTVGYDRLLLAQGARARQLVCPGSQLAGVMTLRTIPDYQQVLQRLAHVRRIVVCGSGTLALESAEALCHLGYDVVHLLRYTTIWPEVLDATASDMVLHEERLAGIEVRTEEEIAEIVGNNGQVAEVVTTRGSHIACDMVLIAIGIEPSIDFVRASGIACGRGIQVDAAMRTNVPNIFAAGDVVETTDLLSGRTRVIGQWYPAIRQAQIAANNMLFQDPQNGSRMHLSPAFAEASSTNPKMSGEIAPGKPSAKPESQFYNATFLYGLDFVSIGLTHMPQAAGYHELIAEPQPRTYRKVIFQQGVPVGALFLGKRQQAFAYKRAIDHHVNLAPVMQSLFMGDFDLDVWLDQQHVPPAIVDGIDAAQPGGGQPSVSTQPPIPRQAALVLIPHPAITVTLEEQLLLPVEENAVCTIGRQQGARLRIDHTSVSRFHAEIAYVNGQYILHDGGSSNGTFVNDARLASADTHILKQDDRVRFGDVQFRFRSPESVPDSDDAEATNVVGLVHRTETRALSKKRVQFEIDMCIGCNRCMEACPVPLSAQVSIADLNQATISTDLAPHVTRFTEECILCGSCVPVCPVDNHRDLLMITLKQHLGPSWNSAMDEASLRRIMPQGLSRAELVKLLRLQRFLSDPQLVPEQYLLHLAMASQFLELPADAIIVREGEYGRNLYMVLSGTLTLSATDINKQELPLAILRPGEFFGEFGMLTGQPYNTTARAQSSAWVLQVPEQVMQRLMELVPEIRSFFTGLPAAYTLKSILKRIALFQGIDDDALEYLIGQAQIKQYERDANLFTEEGQGHPARETLHVLLEGFVKVVRHKLVPDTLRKTAERVIAYRQRGDYFAGGLDLLGDSRAVTVIAINRVHVAEVPYQAVKVLFERYPEVEQRFKQRLQEYIASSMSTQTGVLPAIGAAASPTVRSGSKANLHTLVSGGVVEGTEVLVIDLDTCIHCAECEEACARRHGMSRMNRKGVVLGNLTVVTACRQCQDPVCMLCSRAGIARLPNGEVYITDSCIGCGICAGRCPYDAISIVNVEDHAASEEAASWLRFGEVFRKGIVTERKKRKLPVLNELASPSGKGRVAPGPLDGPQMQTGYDEMRKKVAIKCDLCAGYSDQACVQACPVGAAFRVQPTKFFGSTEEILQK
jgi:NADPH-dependent 2,4-dienoyl-CoA reductase/sulfur reductase-like enzyme/Fe-S-cluster-containing hydrogenase component 2/CRP-like cAMP-binding protein